MNDQRDGENRILLKRSATVGRSIKVVDQIKWRLFVIFFFVGIDVTKDFTTENSAIDVTQIV